MRRGRWCGAVTAVGMSAVLLTACWPLNPRDDCEENAALTCFWERFVPASSSGVGGDGGTPPGCVPSGQGEVSVGDECGVFVSSSDGDDGGEGTKEKPLKTLAVAVAMASGKGKPVYACAETFEEALVLDVSVELFGGLECGNGWKYVGSATKTMLTAGADVIPLVVTSGAQAVRVEDFAVHAADAMKEGGSSIAALAEGATAELVRCEFVAGNGAPGVPGASGDPNGMPAAGGVAGNAGKNACSDLDGMPGPDAMVPGGPQVTNGCGADVSVGGRGGDGNVLNGGGGDIGQTGTKGQAGIGESSMGVWDCDVGGGKIGASGEAGMAGAGATDLGTISASGYTGASGGAGTPGKAGQGGGGGGGAKGGMLCSPGNMTGSGASGGSGGAGLRRASRSRRRSRRG